MANVTERHAITATHRELRILSENAPPYKINQNVLHKWLIVERIAAHFMPDGNGDEKITRFAIKAKPVVLKYDLRVLRFDFFQQFGWKLSIQHTAVFHREGGTVD